MVTRVAASGEEPIMAIGSPGEILGDMTVMDQAPRSATVTALTPCTVHVMSSEQFRTLIPRHDATDAVARHAFVRLRQAEQARFEMKALPVEQRLARTLVRLMASGSTDSICLSQEQLARLIGASRNTVVAALTGLRARGFLTTSRRRLIICDPGGLQRLAAGDTAWPDDSWAV
jgi:CRP-like cAMP-binding protein